MAAEWRRATVADLQAEGVLLVEDGNHGEYRPRPDEFVDVGIAFIRAADMDAGRVLFESASKINERACQRITKGIGRRGDVLLSHKGTVGKVAFVADNAPPFVCSPQTTFWRALNPKVLDRRYLYAYLRSPEFRAQLATRAGETDMAPYVSLTSQRGLSVMLPPIDRQRIIARILGTLDDKIELNRQMNETLEAMNQAIFKSWFVDATQAALPKGWRNGVLSDLTSDVIGGDWGVDRPTDEETRPTFCIRGADIPDLQKCGVGKMPIRYLKPSSLEKRQLREGDLAVEISGGSPTQSTGRPVLVSDSLLRRLDHPLVCSNFCRVLKLKSRDTSKFVYLWLRWLYANDELFQFETGTTGIKNFAFTLFSKKFELAIPPSETLDAFDKAESPLFEKQQANGAESATLAALRDALLPKLLSGEIHLKEMKVPESNLVPMKK